MLCSLWIEWINERTKERTNKQTDERTKKWTNEQTNKQTDQWTNQPTNQPINQWMNQPINLQINQKRTNKRINNNGAESWILGIGLISSQQRGCCKTWSAQSGRWSVAFCGQTKVTASLAVQLLQLCQKGLSQICSFSNCLCLVFSELDVTHSHVQITLKTVNEQMLRLHFARNA